jgi:hypothetical protein
MGALAQLVSLVLQAQLDLMEVLAQLVWMVQPVLQV